MEVEYILFVALGFIASLISAVFGFGTALIMLALGAYILPISLTIVLATVLFGVSTTTKTILFSKHIDWTVAGIMSVASLPFAYLGATMVADFPADLLRRLLGGMILLYLCLTVFNLVPKFKVGMSGLIAGSAAYGFLSGLLGTGNIVKVVVFREMNITKEAFVGAMAATSVFANVAKIAAFSQSGLLHKGLMAPIIGLCVAGILAVLVGRYFLSNISIGQFNTGLQVVLAVSAFGLLL